MVFSPDRRLLAVPMYNGETLVYSLAAPQSPRVFQSEAPAIRVSFSPDSRQLAVASLDRRVTIHQLRTSKEPDRAIFVHDSISWMEFLAEGNQLLISTLNGNSSVWDANRAKLVFETGHSEEDHFYISKYLPKKQVFFGGGSITGVRLYDSRIGMPISGHQYPRYGPVNLGSSPDGKWLAVYRNKLGNITLMETPPIPDRSPDWLPRLAEAVAGPPFPEGSENRDVSPITALLRLKAELKRLVPTDRLADYLVPRE